MDIYVSRPNRSFVPSLIYHNNAMTINKYVEAERRTIPDAPYNGRLSLVSDGNSCARLRDVEDAARPVTPRLPPGYAQVERVRDLSSSQLERTR